MPSLSDKGRVGGFVQKGRLGGDVTEGAGLGGEKAAPQKNSQESKIAHVQSE